MKKNNSKTTTGCSQDGNRYQKNCEEIISVALNIISDLDLKVMKRCLFEGCRYGIEVIDKFPKDKCIYCGRENPQVNLNAQQ